MRGLDVVKNPRLICDGSESLGDWRGSGVLLHLPFGDPWPSRKCWSLSRNVSRRLFRCFACFCSCSPCPSTGRLSLSGIVALHLIAIRQRLFDSVQFAPLN